MYELKQSNEQLVADIYAIQMPVGSALAVGKAQVSLKTLQMVLFCTTWSHRNM